MSKNRNSAIETRKLVLWLLFSTFIVFLGGVLPSILYKILK